MTNEQTIYQHILFFKLNKNLNSEKMKIHLISQTKHAISDSPFGFTQVTSLLFGLSIVVKHVSLFKMGMASTILKVSKIEKHDLPNK